MRDILIWFWAFDHIDHNRAVRAEKLVCRRAVSFFGRLSIMEIDHELRNEIAEIYDVASRFAYVIGGDVVERHDQPKSFVVDLGCGAPLFKYCGRGQNVQRFFLIRCLSVGINAHKKGAHNNNGFKHLASVSLDIAQDIAPDGCEQSHTFTVLAGHLIGGAA